MKKFVSLLLALLLLSGALMAFVSCDSDEVAALKDNIEALASEVQSLSDEIPTESVAQLQTQLSALTEQVNALSGAITAEDLSAVTAQLNGIADSIKTLSGDISNAKLSELNTALSGIATTVTTMASDLSEGQTGIASGLSALNSAQKTLADKLDAIAAVLDAMNAQPEPSPLAFDYGEECFDKIKYIDAVLRDRDCLNGENFKLAVKWIKWNLISAGYSEDEIVEQDFTITRYFSQNTNLDSALSAVKRYETDGKLYERVWDKGWKYVESETGTYIQATITLSNLVVVKKGTSDKQIIIGAHFDGTGTGDNGSGIALALTTAQHVHDIETPNTLVFVFFNAEEYGTFGSTAYANALSEEEVEKTLYMINLDSLVCGDYCNLYSGVQDNDAKTVKDAWPYYNAIEVAEGIGLTFHTNPWTWENPAPGYDTPDYASPSTGDWSDHVGFAKRGIPYLYFEATNWYIPGPYQEYDGYGETYLMGMLMNTKNDYLEYIEKYFPGRILHHITQFSALLNALVLQENVTPGK